MVMKDEDECDTALLDAKEGKGGRYEIPSLYLPTYHAGVERFDASSKKHE